MEKRREAFFSVIEEARRGRGVAIMGVCNVTPDSFSDGGCFFTPEDACARVDALVGEGADVVDIGGESTRPGARAVATDEQLARVLPVVRYAVERVCVTVDTMDPEVAAACLAAGAHAINDVSCLRDDALASVASGYGAPLIVMHARGTQDRMKGLNAYPNTAYGDVVADVVAEWKSAAARAERAGLAADHLVMDPGLGFDKNARHSLELLRRLDEVVRQVGAPVLVGASRKSFLTLADSRAEPGERLGASLAAALTAARKGAAMLRVHDVRATRQALEMSRLLAPAEVA